jgi:hypothetical protein
LTVAADVDQITIEAEPLLIETEAVSAPL